MHIYIPSPAAKWPVYHTRVKWGAVNQEGDLGRGVQNTHNQNPYRIPPQLLRHPCRTHFSRFLSSPPKNLKGQASSPKGHPQASRNREKLLLSLPFPFPSPAPAYIPQIPHPVMITPIFPTTARGPVRNDHSLARPPFFFNLLLSLAYPPHHTPHHARGGARPLLVLEMKSSSTAMLAFLFSSFLFIFLVFVFGLSFSRVDFVGLYDKCFRVA